MPLLEARDFLFGPSVKTLAFNFVRTRDAPSDFDPLRTLQSAYPDFSSTAMGRSSDRPTFSTQCAVSGGRLAPPAEISFGINTDQPAVDLIAILVF